MVVWKNTGANEFCPTKNANSKVKTQAKTQIVSTGEALNYEVRIHDSNRDESQPESRRRTSQLFQLAKLASESTSEAN